MSNSSSVGVSAAMFLYTFAGSADNLISIPVNILALWRIASGNKSLFESEILTLHLVSMETVFSLCFFLSLIRSYHQVNALDPLINFYHGCSVVARALAQCHICVDRYLAVVHPITFIRFKALRYRAVGLVAVWLGAAFSGLSNSFLPKNDTVVVMGAALLLAPAVSLELFCTLSILRILRRAGPGDKRSKGSKDGNQQKTRAVKITCLALAMLVFNVFPFFLFPLFSELTQGSDGVTIAFTMSSVGSSAQAFLFLSRAEKLPCKG